jgi:hypothetical protein
MIKGKATFPFETIALAVAFSPRLEALISETARLSRIHKARTIFIHVGRKTSEKNKILFSALEKFGFNDTNSQVYWESGSTVDSILATCKQQVVDLLILGGLAKDNIDDYFKGSVSRDICRRAKCSVLLLTKPRLHPEPFANIVVNGHEHSKTINTIQAAMYFAQKEGTPEITIAEEMDAPVLSLAVNDKGFVADEPPVENEGISLGKLIDTNFSSPVRIKSRSLARREGESVSKYAVDHHADLLVLNSPDHLLSIFDRIFTHDLEYLLSDIPCNLIIVHSRNSLIL